MLAYLLTLAPVIASVSLALLLFRGEKARHFFSSLFVGAGTFGMYFGVLYLSLEGLVDIPPIGNPSGGKAQGVTLPFIMPILTAVYAGTCFFLDLAVRKGFNEKRSASDLAIYSALCQLAVVSLGFLYLQS